MDNDKLKMRIGDVTQNPEEARKLTAIVSLLEDLSRDESDKLKREVLGDVDARIQAALAAQLESKLPVNPEADKYACMRALYDGMLAGISGARLMPDIVQRYPQLFTQHGKQITNQELDMLTRSTMTTSSTGMSYVLPTPVADEILTYARELVPLRSIVRLWPVSPGTGISGSIPVGTSTRPTCYITSQGAAPTDAVIQPGTFTYSLLKFAVNAPFSGQLYDYAVPAFQSWVNAECGYALAIKQWSQFAVGTDSTQWQGLETASITQVTNPGTVDLDLIAALYLAVPYQHRVKGAWFMNDSTWTKLLIAKDASGKREIPFDLEKNTLYGKPIYSNSALSDDRIYFGDPSTYVMSHGRFLTFVIAPGNGATATTTDTTYVYVAEDCDGGVAMTDAWRYGTLS